MKTPSEAIKAMLLAHVRHDDETFRRVVEEYILGLQARKHDNAAGKLRKVLLNSHSQPFVASAGLSLLEPATPDYPKDKDTGLALFETSEPQRELDELVLADSVKTALRKIIDENRKSELLRAHGLRPESKLLFCGPPGCGKTVTAEAVAKQLNLPLTLVRFDAVVSSFLGQTASNLRKIFDAARRRPSVLLFDEFDAIGKERTDEQDHGELKRVVNSFLQMIDAFRGETLLIAATNHQGILDSAIWRRFDEIVFFDKPTTQMAEELLTRNLSKLGVMPSLRLATFTSELAGMSHGDVERIAVDAMKRCILEGKEMIDKDTLAGAIQRQKARDQTKEKALGANGTQHKTGQR